MTRRKPAAQRHTAASSDSDSDSSDGGVQLNISIYASLELAAAIQRPPDFATAAGELSALLREWYSSGRCDKPVQAAMAEHAALAVECCDSRLQSRAALAALMEAAERHLPQAKRTALLRQYKRSAVQLRRWERRRREPSKAAGGAAGAGARRGVGGEGWSDDDTDGSEGEAPPATFSTLPTDAIERVFRYLDPISLARAACVSQEWRAAAADDSLWQPHCASLASRPPGARRSPAGRAGTSKFSTSRRAQHPPQGQGGPGPSPGAETGSSSWRERFAAAAAQHPERLLQWRTNRVIVYQPGGPRLAWLVPGQHQPGRYRHISTSTVLAYCRRGGRAGSSSGGGGSSGSSSSSGEGSGGEQGEGLSRRLRFWQL